MKAVWFHHMKRMLCLGIASAILGVLILTLAFCLPVNNMTRHVAVAVDKIIEDIPETEENGWQRYLREHRETYTDAIMVQNAIEHIEGKNVYEHAMWVYHLDLDENVWDPEVSVKYLSQNGDTAVMFLHQYSRYWHGYLVYLKPLLLLFNWEQVVWVTAGIQVLLMVAVLVVAARKKHLEIGIAMLIGLLFMKPVLMLVSIDMAVCWIITLGAMLVILLRHDKIEQKDSYPELFLMIGILVAYFDFLSYPVVTLGFPLCAFFLIKKEEQLKQSLKKVIGYCVCWGLGYVGMWGTKWVIADLTLHTGTIKSAVSSILGWTEAIGGRPRFSGGFYVIALNLQEYDLWLYPLVTVILALLDMMAFVYACRSVSLKRVLGCCVPYVLIACIPFVWYIVVQHHSGIHISFTFRIISVAGLALGSLGMGLLRLEKKASDGSGD